MPISIEMRERLDEKAMRMCTSVKKRTWMVFWSVFNQYGTVLSPPFNYTQPLDCQNRRAAPKLLLEWYLA